MLFLRAKWLHTPFSLQEVDGREGPKALPSLLIFNLTDKTDGNRFNFFWLIYSTESQPILLPGSVPLKRHSDIIHP